MNGEPETLNDGLMPTWGHDPKPVPDEPIRPMGWKEWGVLLLMAVAWYGGFYAYWHSIIAAIGLGTEFAFFIGVCAVFFSGEWIK